MDKELIEKYELENIPQEEFGSIDNSTGIRFRYTSELFASFITGENCEEHGVVRLCRHDKSRFKRFINSGILPAYLTENVRGITFLDNLVTGALRSALGIDLTKYDKSDLKCPSIFEELDAAKPLFVPSYNPDPRWQLRLPHGVADFEERSEVRKYSKKLTESRFSDLKNLSFEFWDFVMIHFHDPDPQQDLQLGNYRQDYERLDNLAGEIIELVPENWTIIFMSDHGRLEGKEHNKKAFYSCNQELFPKSEPRITEFKDKIVGAGEK